MSKGQPFSWIDALLIIGIIGLTFGLWYVIWSPGQEMTRQMNMKWESRARMSSLRTAQINFYNAKGHYTRDVDSLILFVQNDMSEGTRDSLFTKLYMTAFSADSLRFSPLGHVPYKVEVVDTAAIARYMITCPDGFGYISSLTNPDEHNKASWEQ